MFAKRAFGSIPPRPKFRFRGCLLFQKDARHTRALATQVQHHIPASVDDKALIGVFDNPDSSYRSSPFAATGLFGHPSLTHPASLISLADATLIRAQLLTDRILRARESRSELLKVVKNLDRLSDMLCGVIDLAELVRNAHPDRLWVGAANQAYETLCEFMNVLNTHVGLYEVRRSLSLSPLHTYILLFSRFLKRFCQTRRSSRHSVPKHIKLP